MVIFTVRPFNCMGGASYNDAPKFEAPKLPKKKKKIFRGVNDPLKRFLHLRTVKSAPKCPKFTKNFHFQVLKSITLSL
jgi:hypothetical protein